MSPDRWVANFDSATAMLRAIAHALHGRRMPTMGQLGERTTKLLVPLSRGIDALPERLREEIYIRAGAAEANRPSTLETIEAEDIAQWTTQMYPRRRFPAIAIGSSNGALTHLWTALGIPWLPQTLLVPVRRDAADVDDIRADLAWGRRTAPSLLERNPELVLHQMIDPVQDRLMVHRMAYFRVKRRKLGDAYRKFLTENLEPGGTIFVVDCSLSWPVTQVSRRHFFQHGALGGPTEDEYHRGGPRVLRFLREQHASRETWDPPPPDGRAPEAEWGFDRDLNEDILELAAARGYRVRRIALEQPEDASPFVADLFAWWNLEQRRIPTRRLCVSSFILFDPLLTIQSGAIPFWMVFNKSPSANALERFVRARPRFGRIDMTLFSHGVRSIGLVPLDRWAAIREQAEDGGREGRLLGVKETRFPLDFGNFVRYHDALERAFPRTYGHETDMPLATFDRFLADRGDSYAMRIDPSPNERHCP